MIHCIRIPVIYGDLHPGGTLRLDALANYLQTAAIDHAATVGQDLGSLGRAGATWILNRLSAVVERQPKRGDPLDVATWATGFGAVRAGREFELRCRGELVARAASTWVYYDVGRGAIRRVPPDVAAAYRPEPEGPAVVATEHGRALVPVGAEAVDAAVAVTLRPSDIDDNGHVNNAAYLDFAAAALERGGSGPAGVPVRFVIEFKREIRAGESGVEVAVERDGAEARFAVFAGGLERARGWVGLSEEAD